DQSDIDFSDGGSGGDDDHGRRGDGGSCAPARNPPEGLAIVAVDDEDEGPAEHGGHDGGRDGSEAGLEPVDFIKDSDSELWMGEVIPGSGVVDDGEHSCAIKEECEKADTSHNGALAECEAEPSSSA
ncbi:unnamed protein product, partial [Symbiodinium pilosum]